MVKPMLNRFPLTLMLLFLATLGMLAQNAKKGYKLLEKPDFEKSYEVFRELLAEDNQSPAALLGLALILADDKSPYFDLIDAWSYARTLNQHVDKLTPEETEFIGEYFYNTEVRHISRPVRKKIEYAVETIEAKLIKYIREENNLEIVYEVIEKFPDFRHYNNVIHIRNQLEFRKYEKLNQLEGYLEFIRKFPDAAQVDKALRYRNKIAFDAACQLNTVEAYRDYMAAYPEAAEINQAVKKLHAVAWERAKNANTIAALDEFMKTYPDALEIAEARILQKQLLFEHARKLQTLEAYNEFIRKYPEGQQYVDIFNLKSLDNGTRFLDRFPLASNNIQWARSFEEEKNYELTACMTADTLNEYLIGGTVFRTDTGSTDAWVIKLSPDGRMIWNKYMGEGNNDEVNLLTINRNNEILGAGYTWIGSDSASRESWLFKLGADGQKLWNKKLGKMHIRSMVVTPTGNTFLGGYVVDDSLQHKYAVIVLNENGKRLWSRTYTGQGEILHVLPCPDDRIVLAGNHWRAKIDARGYLVWESSFGQGDSILSAQVLPRGEICYLGVRNQQKVLFIKSGHDNKLLTEKDLKLADVPLRISRMIQAPQNQLVTLFTFEQYQTVNWIHSGTGELLSSVRIPEGLTVSDLITDRKGNLLLIACQGEIVLIRNNGTAF